MRIFVPIKHHTKKRTRFQIIKKYAKRNRFRCVRCENIFINILKKHNIEFLYQVVIRNKIIDFLIPNRNLIIEIDGKNHEKNGKIILDKKRDYELMKLGFNILRIKNDDIFNKNFSIDQINKYPIMGDKCIDINETNETYWRNNDFRPKHIKDMERIRNEFL